jgi:hypothetical protein
LFAPGSVWNTPLPMNPPIDPASAAWRWSNLWQNHDGSFRAVPGAGPMVFEVSSADRFVPVECTQYVQQGQPTKWRFPAGGIEPIDVVDGHLALVDVDQRLELDLWMTSWDGTTLRGKGMGVFDTTSSGWIGSPGCLRFGATAAGNALTAGLLTPADANRDRINHTLSMVLRTTRAGFIANQATHTDGLGSPWDAPEGARLFLPRTFVVPTNWAHSAKQVAWALQDYGAIVTDKGRWGFQVQGNGDFSGTSWAMPGTHYPMDFPWLSLNLKAMNRVD